MIMLNFFDILYPQKPYCISCNKRLKPNEYILCNECNGKIDVIKPPVCLKCGRELGFSYQSQTTCENCSKSHLHFVEARAYGHYNGALKKLIYEFKYKRRREVSKVLSKKMVKTINRLDWPKFDWLVPTPLHTKRQRERGFNQSELLAKEMSKGLKIPLFNGLVRVKYTEHQTLLDKSSREKNLEGAFDVIKKQDINGKRLLLVDDVYTTGATAEQCAKSLIKAGCRDVFVITCARG